MKVTIEIRDKMLDAVLTTFLINNDVDDADFEKYQSALNEAVKTGEIALDEEYLKKSGNGLKLEIAVGALAIAKVMEDMGK